MKEVCFVFRKANQPSPQLGGIILPYCLFLKQIIIWIFFFTLMKAVRIGNTGTVITKIKFRNNLKGEINRFEPLT